MLAELQIIVTSFCPNKTWYKINVCIVQMTLNVFKQGLTMETLELDENINTTIWCHLRLEINLLLQINCPTQNKQDWQVVQFDWLKICKNSGLSNLLISQKNISAFGYPFKWFYNKTK